MVQCRLTCWADGLVAVWLVGCWLDAWWDDWLAGWLVI